jgi:hypothetical protein
VRDWRCALLLQMRAPRHYCRGPLVSHSSCCQLQAQQHCKDACRHTDISDTITNRAFLWRPCLLTAQSCAASMATYNAWFPWCAALSLMVQKKLLRAECRVAGIMDEEELFWSRRWVRDVCEAVITVRRSRGQWKGGKQVGQILTTNVRHS